MPTTPSNVTFFKSLNTGANSGIVEPLMYIPSASGCSTPTMDIPPSASARSESSITDREYSMYLAGRSSRLSYAQCEQCCLRLYNEDKVYQMYDRLSPHLPIERPDDSDKRERLASQQENPPENPMHEDFPSTGIMFDMT